MSPSFYYMSSPDSWVSWEAHSCGIDDICLTCDESGREGNSSSDDESDKGITGSARILIRVKTKQYHISHMKGGFVEDSKSVDIVILRMVHICLPALWKRSPAVPTVRPTGVPGDHVCQVKCYPESGSSSACFLCLTSFCLRYIHRAGPDVGALRSMRSGLHRIHQR
jgi:hypothetical protein